MEPFFFKLNIMFPSVHSVYIINLSVGRFHSFPISRRHRNHHQGRQPENSEASFENSPCTNSLFSMASFYYRPVSWRSRNDTFANTITK